MSRGFVKEDDQEEVPRVPQRAFLPDGVPNFVTSAGLQLLLEERKELIRERDEINISSENEKRIAVNFINAKLQLLNNRIAEAQVVVSGEQPQNEIRFSAIVTLKAVATGKTQVLQVTGVDEANISKGKISFLSPIARALMNKQAGEKVLVKRDRDEIAFEILKITYIQ
jgi:transcription elongation factor GreB